MSDIDRRYMREALELARRGWGLTSPNPMVGAVVVKNGAIIGRGFHRGAGTPHAEINALSDCAGDPAGSTLYVTLEPCSTAGRTPPCVDAIINAGIKCVVVGCADPNPAHCGRGMALLRRHGIVVRENIELDACSKLNEAFFRWITAKMPFVILKMAMTLDGRIAVSGGESRWITGAAARSEVQRLRRGADAVMIGGETARNDRPSLDVREPDDWRRQPRRLVVSRRMTPEDAAGLLCPGTMPEILAPADAAGWRRELRRLAAEGVMCLLIEGGGELAATVLRAGLVDKTVFFIAPKILGGRGSRPVIGGADPQSLADSMMLEGMEMFRCGDDFCCIGYPCRKSVPEEEE